MEGEFKDDLRNGLEKITYSNGNIIEDLYKNENRNNYDQFICLSFSHLLLLPSFQ